MNTNQEASKTIAELRAAGLSWGSVVQRLNKLGVKTASGKPFKRGNAAATLSQWRNRGAVARAEPDAKGIGLKIAAAVIASNDLSPGEKLLALQRIIQF